MAISSNNPKGLKRSDREPLQVRKPHDPRVREREPLGRTGGRLETPNFAATCRDDVSTRVKSGKAEELRTKPGERSQAKDTSPAKWQDPPGDARDPPARTRGKGRKGRKQGLSEEGRREGSVWAWLHPAQTPSQGATAASNQRLPARQVQRISTSQPMGEGTSQLRGPNTGAPAQFKEEAEDA